MKKSTKVLLTIGVATAAVVVMRRRRNAQAAAEAIPTTGEVHRAVQSRKPVVYFNSSVPPRVRHTQASEPEGGWKAWLTPSALLANLGACTDAGSSPGVAAATCALDNVFGTAAWPPSADADPWQREAWKTAVEASLALAGINQFVPVP